MQHPFKELEREYTSLIQTMAVTKPATTDAVARRLLLPSHRRHYDPVSAKTGVPVAWLAATFEREASSDFSRALGQGDRWDRVSVNVPRGKGPFASWEDAAQFYIRFDHVDDNSAPWSMAYALWKAEIYNGFGYRARGVRSPYLWGGTNHQQPGKYVADGVWDPSKMDAQLGVAPIMLRMIELDSSLAIGPTVLPVTRPPPGPSLPVPIGVGGGTHDTAWLQRSLNELGQQPPLDVDNTYGRVTREAVRQFQRLHGIEVDGLAGDETFAAIEAALKSPRPAPVERPPEAGPPWLIRALKEEGFHETGTNRGIEKYIALAHCGSLGDPYCAIGVNAMLEDIGIPGTRSAMARSFEHHQNFVRLPGPSLGAISTMWRGSPSAGTGHVYFYLGENEHGILGFGFNQDDGANKRYQPIGRHTGYWWPKSAPLPKIGPVKVTDIAGHRASGSEV